MKIFFASSLVAASLAISTIGVTSQNLSVPLIERAKLFGNPSRSGASLAPDGKHLAWLAPRDDVMNIWI
ncbi:MAG: S9 family peptidase, partial [Gammaproteobacteria bacterium]|nr:S9 family peptidase [Gammaproteobacteria bacterium]